MSRTEAIAILTETVLDESVGLGGYTDTAAYKRANGDISAKTDGLSDQVREAIEVAGSLEFSEIGR